MFKNWFKRKATPSSSPSPSSTSFTWKTEATSALELSLKQAPVPGPLKGRLKKELVTAAEAQATAAGRTEVTPEDLMNGLLQKLPPKMQDKVKKMAAKKMQGRR
jgi:hypothetical protein